MIECQKCQYTMAPAHHTNSYTCPKCGHYFMVNTKVVVADRQQGKTTGLVKWLIAGHSIENYPGWSRAIVCVSNDRVLQVTRLVRTASNFLSGLSDRELTDLRKAVWSIDDLNMIGMKFTGFEFAVDDLDLIIPRMFHGNRPSVITMTGTPYNFEDLIKWKDNQR